MSGRLVLVTGGVRSGKSAFAERLATELGDRVLYVATAAALDDEMRRRIEEHRKRRPSHWETLEAESNLAPALMQSFQGKDQGKDQRKERNADGEVVLIDCLALLISNLMMGEDYTVDESFSEGLEERVRKEIDSLLGVARSLSASFIVVSNEVGLGLVPPYRSGRVYRDLLGRANQMVAAEADEVYLLVAGLPVELKALSKKVDNSHSVGIRVEDS